MATFVRMIGHLHDGDLDEPRGSERIEVRTCFRSQHDLVGPEGLARRAPIDPHRATLVRFLAYTGLRWGEATGLRVQDFEPLRRRVYVTENAVAVGGEIIVGTPKTHEARTVPVPAFLIEPMSRLCVGKRRDQLVFGNGIDHVRSPDGRRGWYISAIRRAQEDDPQFQRLTIHDLRHTAASLAVSAGANVKAVQRMLGHKSAAMTLDVYADLFDDDLDAVGAALDLARGLANGEKKGRNAL